MSYSVEHRASANEGIVDEFTGSGLLSISLLAQVVELWYILHQNGKGGIGTHKGLSGHEEPHFRVHGGIAIIRASFNVVHPHHRSCARRANLRAQLSPERVRKGVRTFLPKYTWTNWPSRAKR